MAAPPDALARLEAELAEEKAASLGRIGGVLEEQLAECERLAAAVAAATGEERAVLCARHAEVRRRAELYLWYLVVQREAMGMREQSLVYAMYRIPPVLR